MRDPFVMRTRKMETKVRLFKRISLEFRFKKYSTSSTKIPWGVKLKKIIIFSIFCLIKKF